MKNIGLIMLLLFSLVGCKTKKSHVIKNSYDSSFVNREKKNIDLMAVSSRGINSSEISDSNWNDLIRLKNFTGVISSNGEIKGEADEAELNRSGNKNKKKDQSITAKDSTNLNDNSESNNQGKIKIDNLDNSKESDGISIPWYTWPLVIIVIIILVYTFFKKRLNPF